MIHTSYYAKYKGNAGVVVSLSFPKGFKGGACTALLPPDELFKWYKAEEKKLVELDKIAMKTKDKKDIEKYLNTKRDVHVRFEAEYRNKVLSRLNPKELAVALDGKVLLCWEKFGKFCHRHIIASWLNENGVKCEELIYSSDIK